MTRSTTSTRPEATPKTSGPTPTVADNQAAFEAAVHDLRLEGRTLDIEKVPEIRKVIRNEMTSREAIASIVARRRKGPTRGDRTHG